MSKCKKCKEQHTPGAMYTDDVCAYCKHKIDKWDMNGRCVSRKKDREEAEWIHNYFEGVKHGKEIALLYLYWYKSRELTGFKNVDVLMKFFFPNGRKTKFIMLEKKQYDSVKQMIRDLRKETKC